MYDLNHRRQPGRGNPVRVEAAALKLALVYMQVDKVAHPNDDLASEQLRIAAAALARYDAAKK